MDVTKKADPSGRGEGFSYSRLIRLSIKGGKKTHERLQDSDSDLRSLRDKEVLSILKRMGVPAIEYENLDR